MTQLTLSEWAQIAQIVVTLITSIGIVVSLWFSRRALSEVQADRDLRHAPLLSFEPGGYRVAVSFEKKGKAIPGINPSAVARYFPNLSPDAESVRIAEVRKGDRTVRPDYGALKNFGVGPALSAHVTWVPERVWIGSESFMLDDAKREEPLYCRDLNTMPASPSHIPPGTTAQMTRLPTFIEKDVEKKVTRVEGVLKIVCKDVFGRERTVRQGFRCMTGYKDATPYFDVVFLDLVGK
jgi:hypothetical protein